MKRILKVLGLATALFLMVVLIVVFSPAAQLFVLTKFAPDHAFTVDHAIAAPDYADTANWLAHPDITDNADWTPVGLTSANAESTEAYVFFIHPTAYLGNEHWMGNLDKDTGTQENKQWMMANLASAYNGCCSVYAPYFREATIHAFFQDDELIDGGPALDFAYQDVARAFAHFIRTIPAGSPFIVASHSQGTVHGQRLVQQVIDGTPLVKRLVAAYLIGCTIHEDIFDTYYQDIKACDGPDDLHCVNAYDTWGPDGDHKGMSCPNWSGDSYRRSHAQWLCVNPLSWQRDELKVEQADNSGSVPVQNRYNLSVFGKDKAKGLQWGELQTPLSGLASAQCVDGILRANDQSDGIFSKMAINGNYHGLDYALYYMSIRDNAKHRVALWQQQQQ